MSASHRTGRMTAMGIHDVPPNYSEEAFEAKWKTLVDSIMALPIAPKNFISFDAIFPNNLATEQLKALGSKPARPTVWITLETEARRTSAHFGEVTSDPGIWWHSYAISFVAEVLTKVNVPFPPGGEHGHLIEFVNKTRGLVSRFFELPLAQKLVNYSLWTRNDTNASKRKALGLPDTDSVLMVMFETALTHCHYLQLLTDPTIKSLAEEFLREFGDVDYEVCSADIVVNAKKPV
ncbi:hypothetical protein B0H13DRAFT_2137524, partial [Mycena leptocephala]